MDGVWLPAGGENPAARGLPDSRHTPGPGIAKGEAFSPLVRRRWTDRQCLPGGTGSNRIKDLARDLIPFDKLRTNGCVDGWFAETSRRLSGRGEGERSRCAVRMTAKGSVTPWMACGSRPVERIPELGAFPTVGINQRPGVKGAGPFAPLPPPPTTGGQIAIADRAEPDKPEFRFQSATSRRGAASIRPSNTR